MRVFVVVLALGVTGSFIACAGADPLPPPPPPPPAMPAAPAQHVANADGTPAATPPAPVLLVAGAPAPEPSGPQPQVRLLAPTSGQVIPSGKARDFAVKLDVKNWSVAPASGHVHLWLDGRLAVTSKDLKQPLTLGALTTTPIAEGHHVLAAALSRGNDETLKSKEAVAVAEFYVGKVEPATLDVKKPFLIVTKPDATYEDNDADHVLVDFLAVGAPPPPPTTGTPPEKSAGKQGVALRLEGPGIEGSLTATTTRAVPYYLENLRAGVYTLNVELLGADGQPLTDAGARAGVATRDTRTITIKRSIRTEEPKGPSANAIDAGALTAGDAGDVDAGTTSATSDGGLPRIPPHPYKTKPVLEKPKPPAPPIKKR